MADHPSIEEARNRLAEPRLVPRVLAGLLVVAVVAVVAIAYIVIFRRQTTQEFLRAQAEHNQCIDSERSPLFASEARILAAIVNNDREAIRAEAPELIRVAHRTELLEQICPTPYIDHGVVVRPTPLVPDKP